ncbi:class I SAM-dependent methyltransferase [Pelagicoccus sp. SDUM812003]|uniref:class I SAM-dependent methyltransferase n=1 Tax=Pelagicoccus sp. SDUM812003 TaxID=3041267 RepID=UPI002810481D|nr:class I SAM-dependent methyltransferase [Pelagicoccus sp. SDUM812003]MDQ8202642.1 class I SAM-dependent methyltransferase [Pelagicoccus sp. SDUM812003]
MSEKDTVNHFDKRQAESYDARWQALAPLNDSLHLQLSLVLEEAPEEARVLCVGAGTGAELIALARRFSTWRFLAVDPSAPMLEVCRRKAEANGVADRCAFHVGHVSDVPEAEGVFDAATSLLVSHFIVNLEERLRYFRDIRERLRPGGVLVTSDLCEAPRGQQAELMPVWLRMMRYAGATSEQVEGMLTSYEQNVSMLPEQAMENLLIEAGFSHPTLYAQSLLIRSWFARAKQTHA